jgi:glycosyltransferase involved in cell wall biosynthesis
MRIALVTDAWAPQINGVVRTLSRVVEELRADGHEVLVVSPDKFRTVPCPTYPEIRLAVWPFARVRRLLDDFGPEAIHIATEAPLGWAARRYCRRRGLPFTTSFHTRFPEYVQARTSLPPALGYAVIRRFHKPAARIMVATRTIHDELAKRGFQRLVLWSRGVDTQLFRPQAKDALDLPRPIHLYVGRVAVEKNIRAFLDLDLPGSKAVVGGGPMLDELRRQYPGVAFVGPKQGEDLARHYAAGDVFVFPSKTDTFGLVMLEALACGLPVAAYPVPGPLDVIDGHGIGVLDEDLGKAVAAAREIPSEHCRNFALSFSWRNCARQFLAYLEPIG